MHMLVTLPILQIFIFVKFCSVDSVNEHNTDIPIMLLVIFLRFVHPIANKSKAF